MAVQQQFDKISPELLTPDHVRGLSLHETTAQYGTHGLTIRLLDELASTGLDQEPEVMWSMWFGLTLHANQTRTNGHYKDHILRVALRPIVHYGIVDPTVTAGGLLHDGPEDHPFDIVRMLTGETETDKAIARERAFELIATHATPEVAEVVEVVTNPIIQDGQDKWQVYHDHTRDKVLPSRKGRVNKISDFTDNGVGNHYTDESKQEKLDRKYLDLYRLHAMGLYYPDSMITGETRNKVLRQLHEGHSRALARLAMSV